MARVFWAILTAFPLFLAGSGAVYSQALFTPAEDRTEEARETAPAPASPNIHVDGEGRKTLVLRGDDPPLPAASDKAKTTEAEKPYWQADKKEAEAPYFQAEKKPAAAPYWQRQDSGEARPYWQAAEEKNERPYWLAWKPEPKPAPETQTVSAAEAAAAKGRQIISFYMYKDEEGVTHLANAPTDPRYRLFTVEVEIRVSRGLAPRNTRFTHESLRPYIMEASAIYGVEPALIAAVIQSESAFDSQAVSWAGAQGLMQLMPATAREMGCRDPFDPRQNIMGGARYLGLMLRRFGGDMTLAAAAYNAGPERVARRWRVPDIAETKNYVVIVRRNYEKYLGSF